MHLNHVYPVPYSGLTGHLPAIRGASALDQTLITYSVLQYLSVRVGQPRQCRTAHQLWADRRRGPQKRALPHHLRRPVTESACADRRRGRQTTARSMHNLDLRAAVGESANGGGSTQKTETENPREDPAEGAEENVG